MVSCQTQEISSQLILFVPSPYCICTYVPSCHLCSTCFYIFQNEKKRLWSILTSRMNVWTKSKWEVMKRRLKENLSPRRRRPNPSMDAPPAAMMSYALNGNAKVCVGKWETGLKIRFWTAWFRTGSFLMWNCLLTELICHKCNFKGWGIIKPV